MVVDKKLYVDVVIVGFGWIGVIFVKELIEVGLNVVVLECGEYCDIYLDGVYLNMIDELIYNICKKLFFDLLKMIVLICYGLQDIVLLYWQFVVFLLGEGVGGVGLYWLGVYFWIMLEELCLCSYYEECYGKKFIFEGMMIQDMGVMYDEFELYFDFVEKVFGMLGQVYKVGGKVVGDGNVFEVNCSDNFLLLVQFNMYLVQCFFDVVYLFGLYLYWLLLVNMLGLYMNLYGVQMGLCNFCGYCSGYVCYMYLKVLLNLNILLVLKQVLNFELCLKCYVLCVDFDDMKKCVIGVIYVDLVGCEVYQLVDFVIVVVFQYYNVYLLLLLGIGKLYDLILGEGVVGCNFVYQNLLMIKVFFDKDIYMNLFIGVGGNGVVVDDFNVDNFDYGLFGFVGGLLLWVNQVGVKLISGIVMLFGMLQWGLVWKKVVKDNYVYMILMDVYGINMLYCDVYFDFDLIYCDLYGQLLLWMMFDWKDNDIRMVQYVIGQMKKIVEVMGLKVIGVLMCEFGKYFDLCQYQMIYFVGGVIMGIDLKMSVLNCYLQCWDVYNVFVMGVFVLLQGIGYNLIGIIVVLVYWLVCVICE